MLSDINVIREVDFLSAWEKSLCFVLDYGNEIVFGRDKKQALDSCQLIELTGRAIDQIESRVVHPKFPFGGNRLDQYCEEYTREYLNKYDKLSAEEKFSYQYFDRLVNPVDQIMTMRDNLSIQIENNVMNNNCQAITWRTEEDMISVDAPCLQFLQVRYVGDNEVDVHIHFRSRDLYGAWPANIIAIVDMLNREVIRPNKCKVARIIDFSDSLHVYEKDLDSVEDILISPMVRNH